MVINSIRISALLAATSLLGACSSGSGASYDGYLTELGQIAENLEAQGISDPSDITPLDNIPTSGNAQYAGVMIWDTGDALSEREVYAGDMTVFADFDAPPGDTLDGSVKNIIDDSDRAVTGVLDVTFGAIDRLADPLTEYQAIMDLEGDLTDADGVSYAFSSIADGDFVGSNYQGLVGEIEGTMTSTVYGAETVFGGYLLER